MAESKDQQWKEQQGAPEPLEDLVKTGSHPVGLDVGTSKVVSARSGGKDVGCAFQLNAFIPVPYSPVTERTIQQQKEIHHFRDGDDIVIFGSATDRFANMFNAEHRRPMADGMLNPREDLAMPVIEVMLEAMVPRAATAGEVLAFSVPAASEGRDQQLTYHEATLRRMAYQTPRRPLGIAVACLALPGLPTRHRP